MNRIKYQQVRTHLVHAAVVNNDVALGSPRVAVRRHLRDVLLEPIPAQKVHERSGDAPLLSGTGEAFQHYFMCVD
jgi:hypothetical protein